MDEIRLELPEGRVLRSLRADDVDALYAVSVANADHLRPWHAWANDIQREHTEAYVTSILAAFARGEALPGVIEEGDEIVGNCAFNQVEKQNEAAAIGYWLAASHVGRGVMTAAVRALITYGFDVLALHRIEIGAAPHNTRSRAIPERLGFTEEGTLREAERHPDRYGDIVLYSLLREEWRG